MSEARRIVSFRGGVSCLRDEGPLGLTLLGRTADRPGEIATLSFVGLAPQDLPEALEDATVDQAAPGEYRIGSGRREWVCSARSVHLHREVSTTFYQAIRPRVVPWTKKLFWGMVLSMVSSRVGKSVLLILRRR